jgi:hypothetical protein
VKVVRILIVRTPSSGVDHISLQIEGPSPWPQLEAATPGQYPPYLKVETPRGYAETWLNLMGYDPALITIVGIPYPE